MSERSPAEAALQRIAAPSGVRIFPPTLLPARTILELSGEAVRARLCTFVDTAGDEIALRPDMTTPIALMAATGDIPTGRYHYSGEVFRLSQPDSREPVEFRQIGFEWFGGGDHAEDAEALALTALAVADGGGGGADAGLRFGDVAVFRALVDALPLSPRWREKLKRAFARKRGPRELLEAAKSGDDRASLLGASLVHLTDDDARRAVEEMFVIAGVQPMGGRGAAEIAERLRELASDHEPPAPAADTLTAYLAMVGSSGDCTSQLSAFLRKAGVKIDEAMDRFAARAAELKRLDPPMWASAHYSSQAGRRFEYYDGFVFDIAPARELDRPVAAGGRYDGLIARLSAQAGREGARTPAIGAAIRASRLGRGS